MKKSLVFIALGLLVASASTVVAQQKPADKPTPPASKPADKPAAPAKPDVKAPAAPGGDDKMAAYMKAGEPGPEQKALAKQVGKWDCAVEWWMAAGQPSEKAHAVMTCEMIMNDRFLRGNVIGDEMGPPGSPKFEGMLISGYDRGAKKWQMTWIDNTSTATTHEEATASADAKTREYKGVMTDPVTGKVNPVREVQVFESDDRYTMDTYTIGDDGKEFKSMRIVYTRLKK